MIGLVVPEAVCPPGDDVTVYSVMGSPFAVAPEKLTCAEVFPGMAVTVVGAPGTPAGVTLFDTPDAEPVPTAFVAVTVNVYGVPFASPLTVIGLVAPVPVNPLGDDVTV